VGKKKKKRNFNASEKGEKLHSRGTKEKERTFVGANPRYSVASAPGGERKRRRRTLLIFRRASAYRPLTHDHEEGRIPYK